MQRLVGTDSLGATALALGQKRCKAHFVKDVQAVVAGRTVSAKAYVDSRFH